MIVEIRCVIFDNYASLISQEVPHEALESFRF